jgi:small subunit ribosomal protein S16
MLVIRYQRTGKRNKAYFRLVVAEKTRAVSGKFLEVVGSIDPHKKQIQLKKERIEHWLSVGAQPSDTAHNMLVREGVIKAPKRKITIRQKPKAEGAEETPAAPAATPAAAPVAPAAPTEKPAPATEKPAEEKKEETK